MKGFNGEADGSFPNSKDPASANAAKMRSNARAAAATNTNDPESDLGAQSNALSESGAGSGEIMELEEPKPVWAPLEGAGKVKAVTAGGGDVYSLGSEGQIKKWDSFYSKWVCIEMLPGATAISAGGGALYGLATGGRLFRYSGNGLGESTASCPQTTDLDVWVHIAGPGHSSGGDGGGMQGLASSGRNLFAIGSDGAVYRWLGGLGERSRWEKTSAFEAEMPLASDGSGSSNSAVAPVVAPSAESIRASSGRLFMVAKT